MTLRLETRRKVARCGTLLYLVLGACLDGPVVDPTASRLGYLGIVHDWTGVLEGDSGRVWVVQTDTVVASDPAGRTRWFRVSLWSALD